jgi:subtilisin family serine protease
MKRTASHEERFMGAARVGHHGVTARTLSALAAAALAALTAWSPAPKTDADRAPYIVQAHDAAAAAAAVRGVGGTVSHELGIIQAVAGRLDEAQARALTARGLRVYADREVRTAADIVSWTVSDSFATVAYSNNVGTKPWTGSWLEGGDDGKPGTGKVVISSGTLRLADKSRAISRSADLGGAASAVLTFTYRREGYASSSEYVSVLVSSDGGATFAELGRIAGPGKDAAQVPTSYDISGFAAANTVLRFATSAQTSTKKVFLDDVRIAYEVPAPPPPAPVLDRTLRDEFRAVSYEGNDGTHRFEQGWHEYGDDGWWAGGLTRVVDYQGSGRLLVRGCDSIWRRGALPPTSTAAQLSFAYSRVSLESGDYLSVQASPDFQSFTEIGRVQGPANDTTFRTASFDFTPFIGLYSTVRFVPHISNADDGLDAVYLDDVQIAFDGAYPAGTAVPALPGASQLHAEGTTGAGVTVAVLDTGYWKHEATDRTTSGAWRVLVQYDAERNAVDMINGSVTSDMNGHGSHVTSSILNTETTPEGQFLGVAPDARLVSVKAFGTNGGSTYATVIRGIDWVVQNRATYGIRVLNCSFSAPPQSHYWDDPLAQAVMKAWQAGIVVVASAGNTGPNPMTIGVPGNVPYVITVGAMTDNYTPSNGSDDKLASFSAAGPTVEGFVKPDLVAPGGHVWAFMPTGSHIAQSHPAYRNDGDYFMMSGTSQAAAVVSGVAALVLQKNPSFTPDDVKCALMSGARPATRADGTLAYGVFQQGAGVVDPYAAAYAIPNGCANAALDLAADLAGTQRFGGPAWRDANGRYYVLEQPGYEWNGTYSGASGYPWSNGYPWSSGYPWSDGYPWSNGYPWSSGYPWSNGYPWSSGLVEPAAINAWVDQE